MEGARSIFDYIAVGIIVFVILAMLTLLARTFTLVLGFLSLPVAESLERLTRRWRKPEQPPSGDGPR